MAEASVDPDIRAERVTPDQFIRMAEFIAANAPDRLGRLLAYGMTFLIFFQAMFNLGVVTGCLPTKGLALPFISYGGTNLITAMVAVGTLFNVGRQIDDLPLTRAIGSFTAGSFRTNLV